MGHLCLIQLQTLSNDYLQVCRESRVHLSNKRNICESGKSLNLIFTSYSLIFRLNDLPQSNPYPSPQAKIVVY